MKIKRYIVYAHIFFHSLVSAQNVLNYKLIRICREFVLYTLGVNMIYFHFFFSRHKIPPGINSTCQRVQAIFIPIITPLTLPVVSPLQTMLCRCATD